jgi:hypothetical protein
LKHHGALDLSLYRGTMTHSDVNVMSLPRSSLRSQQRTALRLMRVLLSFEMIQVDLLVLLLSSLNVILSVLVHLQVWVRLLFL